jgi:hypothetical protein
VVLADYLRIFEEETKYDDEVANLTVKILHPTL